MGISVDQRKATVVAQVPDYSVTRHNNKPFKFLTKKKAQSKICAQTRISAPCVTMNYVWSTPHEDPVVRMKDAPRTNAPQPNRLTENSIDVAF